LKQDWEKFEKEQKGLSKVKEDLKESRDEAGREYAAA